MLVKNVRNDQGSGNEEDRHYASGVCINNPLQPAKEAPKKKAPKEKKSVSDKGQEV